MERIDRTTPIEELVDGVPRVVSYLIDRGLPCIVCGQPSWGTLEELAREKGYSDEDITQLVEDMNRNLLGKDHA